MLSTSSLLLVGLHCLLLSHTDAHRINCSSIRVSVLVTGTAERPETSATEGSLGLKCLSRITAPSREGQAFCWTGQMYHFKTF